MLQHDDSSIRVTASGAARRRVWRSEYALCLDPTTTPGETCTMTWIKIGYQERAGAGWVPTDPTQSIEKYKHRYDAGEIAMCQRRSSDGVGFDLLIENNPKPYKARQYHLRWFRPARPPVRHYAARKWTRGKGKYD